MYTDCSLHTYSSRGDSVLPKMASETEHLKDYLKCLPRAEHLSNRQLNVIMHGETLKHDPYPV